MPAGCSIEQLRSHAYQLACHHEPLILSRLIMGQSFQLSNLSNRILCDNYRAKTHAKATGVQFARTA